MEKSLRSQRRKTVNVVYYNIISGVAGLQELSYICRHLIVGIVAVFIRQLNVELVHNIEVALICGVRCGVSCYLFRTLYEVV